MKSKIKNTALLLIIVLGLFPIGNAAAESPAEGALDESLALLYASRSILLNDVDLEEANRAQNALMSTSPQGSNDANGALAHLIHATKQQRNELNDSYRTLRAAYQAEGKTCELQILEEYYKAEKAKLDLRLGYLHRLRGDRRRALTRLWHSVKRSGNRIWTAVGPVGRRILKNVGSEAVQVVLSGGSLGGGVIRKLVIKEARNVGEAELNRLLERGVGRFMQSQAALAVAAGVSDCTAEKLDEARQQVAGDVGEPAAEKNGNDPEPESADPSITFTGQSTFLCDQWVGDAGDADGMAKIPLEVNFNSGEFYGEASFPFLDQMDLPQTSTYTYEGTVSQEGILIGKSTVSSTTNNIHVTSIGITVELLGVVTDDGRGIYLFTTQESDTEMIGLFEDGREAVLNDLKNWGLSNNTSEYPPVCR